MDIIYTTDQLNASQNAVKLFEQSYNKAFPDSNEREDFEIICRRIREKTFSDDPKTFLIIEGASGLVVEFYPSCTCLLLTYIVVSENERGKGIARDLLSDTGLKAVMKIIKDATGKDIKAVFFESNNPLKTVNDSFDPSLRLAIFRKLGARHLNIKYVQPSLGPGKQRVENLLLFVFPINSRNVIESETVLSFLQSLYKELGVDQPDSDADFIAMRDDLKAPVIELSEVPVSEVPVFRFHKSSVAYHVPVDWKYEFSGSCADYNSFETDLFSYQHQKNKPFQNFCLNSHNPTPIEILFPEKIHYQSEGRLETLLSLPKDENTVLKARMYTTLSCFKEHSVFSFIIQPADYFNEYDIIKLASLFGSKQENSDLTFFIRRPGDMEMKPEEFLNDEIRFQTKSGMRNFKLINSGKSTSIEVNANSIVTGTINLCFHPDFMKGDKDEYMPFFETIHKAEKPKPEDIKRLIEAYKNQYTALGNTLCGIALGIFDFHRMESDEFLDTIKPVNSDPESFVVLNRGVVLLAYCSAETRNIYDSIGSDPYILIPNIYLTIQEYRLREALRIISDEKMKKKNPNKIKIIIDKAEKLLKENSSGVFQYESEKQLCQIGTHERRLIDLQNEVDKNFRLAKERLSFTQYRNSTLSANIIAMFLIVMTINQMDGLMKSLITGSSDGVWTEIYIKGSLIIVAITAYLIKIRSDLNR